MKHLGIYLTSQKIEEKLVDLETGEILADNLLEKWWYLRMLQESGIEYTLQLV